MKNLAPLALLCLIAPTLALGATFNEKCPDIPTCAQVVGDLLGQKYVFDSDLKGKTFATPNLELTQANAELLFTNSLHMEGYTRVPLSQPGTFQIQRQHDARDSTLPLVTADKTHTPQLPNNWDMMTLEYKASHADAVEQIARMSRNFMPANARIVPSELSGTLRVTDSAANLKKLYTLIKDEDQKPTAEMKKRWAEAEKRRAIEAAQRKHDEAQAKPALSSPVKSN